MGEHTGSSLGEHTGWFLGEHTGWFLGEHTGSPLGEHTGSPLGEHTGSPLRCQNRNSLLKTNRIVAQNRYSFVQNKSRAGRTFGGLYERISVHGRD